MCNPIPLFNVGDRVKAQAFIDSSKQFHPEVTELIVQRVQMCESKYMKPYFRVYAEHTSYTARINAFEASERFFAFDIQKGKETVKSMPRFTMTKAEALAIQAEQIQFYSKRCAGLAAKVAALTTADQLEDGKQYPVRVINRHIPRGGDIEYLCGVKGQGD